ncbi:MAG TPA: FAD-dependent oxidoreductase, partial [Pseudomonadales bacterium]
MTPSRDVLVVGGGLVGAAAALGLARSGRTVVLVDRSRPSASTGRFGMDVRNIACSPASRTLLETLGVWSALHGAPYLRMCVWEERGTAALHFDAAEAGRTELGWILENGPTVEALWRQLEAEAGVEIRIGTLDGVSIDADRVQVTVDGRPCAGRLLVGVDGARSA